VIFTLGRLKTLRPRLLEKWQHTVETEKVNTWFAKYHALLPKQEALAAEFRDVMALYYKIVDVFVRCRAFDKEAHLLNLERGPNITEHMLEVELYARGLERFDTGHRSIIGDTQLAFGNGTNIWPPRQVIDPMVYGGAIRDRHPGRDCSAVGHTPILRKPALLAHTTRRRVLYEGVSVGTSVCERKLLDRICRSQGRRRQRLSQVRGPRPRRLNLMLKPTSTHATARS
jgi:hypothetical protein